MEFFMEIPMKKCIADINLRKMPAVVDAMASSILMETNLAIEEKVAL